MCIIIAREIFLKNQSAGRSAGRSAENVRAAGRARAEKFLRADFLVSVWAGPARGPLLDTFAGRPVYITGFGEGITQ